MNIFKAFAQIGPLNDNTSGIVAPVGEISPLSRTFTRDKATFTFPEYNEQSIISFSYTVDGVHQLVDSATAKSCMAAVDWVYTNARLDVFSESKDSFQQAFIGSKGDTYDLINSGEMVPFGNHFAPAYIEIAPYQQSATISWKIWLSDEAFYNQYDEFTILPLTPIVGLDQFFGNYTQVKALIDSIQQTDTFNRLNALRGGYPATNERNDVYAWRDKNDHSLKIDTNWVSVIYGEAGDNLDASKEATVQYVLANSAHTRDEWAEIFPDLFTSTEFIITPMWDSMAVPKETRQNGIYSGILGVQEAMSLCHSACQGVKYTNVHIDNVLCAVPSQFRSLMLAIVGGPENRDNVNMFNMRYPDYINVPTTHVDFMQMTEETRGFVMMLAAMVMYAEAMTPTTGVPHGYNRIIRNGVVYVAASYKKFLYLVTTKYSVDKIYDLAAAGA